MKKKIKTWLIHFLGGVTEKTFITQYQKIREKF